jgi:Domain of unknown function (DUF4390)
MMVSFTHCFKNAWANLARCCVLVGALLLCVGGAHAQSTADATQFRVERIDDEILVSTLIQFELPSAVEEALLKGIPMVFVAEADVLRERWYWYDKKIVSTQRQMRLAYQPLTRRWRLNINAGLGSVVPMGLALNQSLDTLAQALSVIKRVSRWKVADISELDPAVKYKVEFRFRLDLTQLPRPFQIGALGQSEWDISAVITQPLSFEVAK